MIIIGTDDEENAVYRLGIYIPYGYLKMMGLRPSPHQKKVMDIKINGEAPQKDWAIRHFYDIIDPIIAPEVAITCVPSHDPADQSSGILRLARLLAAHNRVDATSCIRKIYKTESMHNGGIRNSAILRGSLELDNQEIIAGKDVLLLDDVHTTGTSVDVCRALLWEANPNKIVTLVLGYTQHPDDN